MPNEDKWYISGPLGIGTSEPVAGKLQFDNGGGNKIVVFDLGPTNRYGFGLNTGNLNAFVPADGRFSIRQNGADGTEVMTITGTGNVGIGTSPSSGKLQFDNSGGDKIVVFDLGPTNRYGFGLNTGNLNAFVPAGGRFSVRQNGHDGTEVMTITDTGNVGIANELTVGAGGNAVLRTRHIEGKQGGKDDPDTLYLNWVSGKDVQVGEPSRQSNLFVCGNIGIGTPNPTSARLQFDNNGGDKVVVYDAGPTDRYGFGLNSGNLNAFVPAGGRFSVRQNGHDGNEVMTITGTGNLGIGTTTPAVALHLGNKVAGEQARIQLDNANGQNGQINRWTNRLEISSSDAITHTIDLANGTSKEVLIVKWEGIHVNGQAWKPDGGNWAKPSDLRLKKNVASLKASLDQLLKLRGVIFQWNEPEKHGNLTGVQRGFIAQEVEQVFPEWVGEDSKGHKFITIYGFEALTIEAFRELKTNIDILNKRIQLIESTTNQNNTTQLGANSLRGESFC